MQQTLLERLGGQPTERLRQGVGEIGVTVEQDRLVTPELWLLGVAHQEDQAVDRDLRPDRHLEVADARDADLAAGRHLPLSEPGARVTTASSAASQRLGLAG